MRERSWRTPRRLQPLAGGGALDRARQRAAVDAQPQRDRAHGVALLVQAQGAREQVLAQGRRHLSPPRPGICRRRDRAPQAGGFYEAQSATSVAASWTAPLPSAEIFFDR
jgi:hypothetical protein